EALGDDGGQALPLSAETRRDEKHFVAIAGRREPGRFVAGIVVAPGRHLRLEGHEELHVRAGRAVELVGALADRLAESEGAFHVIAADVGDAVTDPVDAVPPLGCGAWRGRRREWPRAREGS